MTVTITCEGHSMLGDNDKFPSMCMQFDDKTHSKLAHFICDKCGYQKHRRVKGYLTDRGKQK